MEKRFPKTVKTGSYGGEAQKLKTVQTLKIMPDAGSSYVKLYVKQTATSESPVATVRTASKLRLHYRGQ